MKLISRCFLLIIFLSTAFISNLTSQVRILQRSSSEIPPEYIKYIQNEHRKLINLNGEWDVFSQEPAFSAKFRVPFSFDFKGRVTCRRNFSVGNEEPVNYVLFCDGINYQCDIIINGRFIVKHEGGFSPFSTVLPEGILSSLNNTIEIKVDNSLDNSRSIPLKSTVNYPKGYGGIFRDIYLVSVPKVFVKSINVRSEVDINYNADIKNVVTVTTTGLSRFQPNDRKFSILTEIIDTAGEIKASGAKVEFQVSANSTISVTSRLSFSNPQFWSPDSPFLYTLKVTLFSGEEVVDTYYSDYGVWELVRRSNTFILNGKEFKLKGVNYIEEFPGTGLSGTYYDTERDVLLIKSLGCNSIRVYGRQASPYLIRLCSKYGLFILEELSAVNVPSSIIGSEDFIGLAENHTKEMIQNHEGSPSVFAYGIGNDLDVLSQETRLYIKNLADICRTHDNRLVYYTTRNYFNDPCRNLVDIVGINIYDEETSTLRNIASDTKLKKEMIFIGYYGRMIDPNNRSGYSDPNSIEAQSKFIADSYRIIKNSSLAGSFFFSFTDWNSDLPSLKSMDPSNHLMRTSGLFNFFREQRDPAVILRKSYMNEDMPNFNIGSYTKESPLFFVITGLATFILFIYLANSVRRFRDNIWRAFFRPFIFFSDVREQNLVSFFQNILLALIISTGTALFFSNLFYYWKESQLLDIIISVMVSSETVKILINQYIHSPSKLTIFLSLVVFIKIILVSFIIWLFSLTVKFKVNYNNILTVTVWGFLPLIILLAAGTFYVRILYVNQDFAVIGLLLAAVLAVISVFRVLKGTYIIFDAFFVKVYSYGLMTIVLIIGSMWLYLNSTRFISDYIRLISTFMKG